MFKTYTFDKFNSFYYRRKKYKFNIKSLIPTGIYCSGYFIKCISDDIDENTKKGICPYHIRVHGQEDYCILCEYNQMLISPILEDGYKICGINKWNLHIDSKEIIELANNHFHSIVIKMNDNNINAIYNRLANIYTNTVSYLYNSYNYLYSFEYQCGETKLERELEFNTSDKYKKFIIMNNIIDLFAEFYTDLIEEHNNLKIFDEKGFIPLKF